MRTLLKLPTETLLQIVENVIVNFAISCKYINTLVKNYLKVHQQRFKTYHNVILWGCYHHPEEERPLVLVQDILQDWKIAYYAKSIEVKCCGYDPVVENWQRWADRDQRQQLEVETAIVQSLLNGITTELRKKLITLFHLADDEADDNFHLIKECNRAMVLSLLSLLPSWNHLLQRIWLLRLQLARGFGSYHDVPITLD